MDKDDEYKTPTIIRTKQEVGGFEFDATSASGNMTKNLQKRQSYEAKKHILYPLRKTKLDMIENAYWKEPCFSSKDDIVPNPKKKAYTRKNFIDTFYRGYYSISELPIFGWSYHTAEKGKKYIFPKTLLKFLYCFFVKLLGSPLYVAYLAGRIIFMMAKAILLKIPLILAASINSIAFAITGVAWLLTIGRAPLMYKIVPWVYYRTDKITGETLPEPVTYYPVLGALMGGLFGLSIPFQTISPRLGSKYGRGEIGVFVFIVMLVSAVIITITGINIAVIMATFIYFMVKTFFGIQEKAMGKDLRKGGN